MLQQFAKLFLISTCLAFALFCSAPFFLASPSVQAQSIVYTDSIPLTYTNWANVFEFPKFDPNLGILTRIDLTSTGHVSGSIGYENFPGITAISVTGEITADLQIHLPSTTALLANGSLLGINDSLQSFDGSTDFGGTSGRRVPYTGDINAAAHYATPSFLNQFIGSGTISMPVTARASFNSSGTSNLLLALLSQAGADAILRYNYAVPNITLEKLVNGAIADAPNDSDVPLIKPNDPVVWTYVITNTGTVAIPLASIVLTDSQPGIVPQRVITSDLNSDGLLSPAESWRYTATAPALNLIAPPPAGVTIVSGCNPSGQANPGPRPTYVNLATVRIPASSVSDPAHYCNPANPAIAMRKLINGLDANNPNGADVPWFSPGARITWTYIVTNTGNITFAQNTVVMTDSHTGIVPTLVISSDLRGDGQLSPGESWLYTATGTAADLLVPPPSTTVVPGCTGSGTPSLLRPAYENIGRVTVPGATASDPSHYCNPIRPAIGIVKTVYAGHNNGVDCPGDHTLITLNINDPITYCFTVKNTGNTYLSSLTFSDPALSLTGLISGISALKLMTGTLPLAPGASLVYYTESSNPAGGRHNCAAVEGNPTDQTGVDLPGLNNPRDEDCATTTLPTGGEESGEPGLRLFLPVARR